MPARKGGFRLTPRAEIDLEDIWLYTLRTWSLAQADRYVETLFAAFEDLAAGRKTGRPVDFGKGYLKIPVEAHVVFFRMTNDGLVVVRVLHRRMDVERHL